MSVPRIALHEFMPYGAPDLLAESREQTARALAAATSFLGAAFVALLVVSPFLARVPVSEDTPERVVIFEPPPPLDVPRVQAPFAPTAPDRIVTSVPLPVPGTSAPPDATIYSQQDLRGPGVGDGPDVAAVPGLLPAPPAESIPDPSVYRYVEELPAVATSFTPAYPELARDAGVEGDVIVLAYVGVDGRVRDARIVKSVPLLDAAAADAVLRWRFTPALNNGQPVAVWVRVPVRFRLH